MEHSPEKPQPSSLLQPCWLPTSYATGSSPCCPAGVGASGEQACTLHAHRSSQGHTVQHGVAVPSDKLAWQLLSIREQGRGTGLTQESNGRVLWVDTREVYLESTRLSSVLTRRDPAGTGQVQGMPTHCRIGTGGPRTVSVTPQPRLPLCCCPGSCSPKPGPSQSRPLGPRRCKLGSPRPAQPPPVAVRVQPGFRAQCQPISPAGQVAGAAEAWVSHPLQLFPVPLPSSP